MSTNVHCYPAEIKHGLQENSTPTGEFGDFPTKHLHSSGISQPAMFDYPIGYRLVPRRFAQSWAIAIEGHLRFRTFGSMMDWKSIVNSAMCICK